MGDNSHELSKPIFWESKKQNQNIVSWILTQHAMQIIWDVRVKTVLKIPTQLLPCTSHFVLRLKQQQQQQQQS